MTSPLDLSQGGLAGALAALAAYPTRGPRTALRYRGVSVSLAGLERRSRAVAGGLAARGIRKGDAVALWLPNVPAWLVAFFALARLGALAVATNTRFRSREIADIWSRAGVKAAIYWPTYRGIDFPAILGDALGAVNSIRFLVAYSEDVVPAETPRGVPSLAWSELESARPADAIDGGAGDLCLSFTTSGTTSRPKIVAHRQASILAHAPDVARAFGFDAPGAKTIQVLPYCGTYGFSQAMGALFAGCPAVVEPTFDGARVARHILDEGVTLAALNLDMVEAIYRSVPEQVPFPGLRLFLGTHSHTLGPMGRERGFRLRGLYGSSEVQGMYSLQPDVDADDPRIQYGGFPVSPRARSRARDLETGAVLPDGKDGELEFSGPGLFDRYLNDAEATRRAFTDDGWFRSGDLGHTRPGGSFHFISRIGDVLRLGGFLVNPAEIESHVEAFPGVTRCQVVGVEEDRRTRAVAFYLAAEDIPEDALRRHCEQAIARFKVPARFQRLAEFPVVTSANNTKVVRSSLRERAAALLSAQDREGEVR